MQYRNHIKATLDWCVALTLMVFFSWLFIVIIVVYLMLWEFPIFFKQRRVGKNDMSFWMWKFRTLKPGKNLSNNDRVFWWGKFLRLTSLDELPQLWNVLRGEMSFVGPRPLPEEYLPLYSCDQLKRHEVAPGITGWAQVNGRSSISWKKKFEMDIFYVDNISFKLDLLIFFRTIALLLSFKEDVSLAEKKFKGN